MKPMTKEKTIDFGFEEVPVSEKAAQSARRVR